MPFVKLFCACRRILDKSFASPESAALAEIYFNQGHGNKICKPVNELEYRRIVKEFLDKKDKGITNGKILRTEE